MSEEERKQLAKRSIIWDNFHKGKKQNLLILIVGNYHKHSIANRFLNGEFWQLSPEASHRGHAGGHQSVVSGKRTVPGNKEKEK